MATPWSLQRRDLQSGPQKYITTVEAAKRQQHSTSAKSRGKRPHQGDQGEHGDPIRSCSVDVAKQVQPHTKFDHRGSRHLQASVITRRQTTQATPAIVIPRENDDASSQNPLLSLAHPTYGLPSRLVENFTLLGLRSIYPWQASCLLRDGLLDGQRNLIYTAPTGSGKSLVAEVLLLKRVICQRRCRAILVLPYVALVQEKLRWLRRVVQGVVKTTNPPGQHSGPTDEQGQHIRIGAFYGGNKSKDTWADCDVAVCTIEKANSLVNTALEEGKIDELGVVVLDELHMLDDRHRGYIMELMTTKLLLLEAVVQIIGMSATLPNPDLLATWLQARSYVSKHRPIPVHEHLVCDNAVYAATAAQNSMRTLFDELLNPSATRSVEPIGVISTSSYPELAGPVINSVTALAIETASAGYGALVFCGSRQGVQNVASLISNAMPAGLTLADDHHWDVLAALQALPLGYEKLLASTIVAGVGFHHAGLTIEEREIVAEAFDRGVLKVLVATCSLAAGINLPARRVILHGARMGRDLLGPAMLHQMRGRAGRKGKDERGETFLVCHKHDLEAVTSLLEADLPPVTSCLIAERRGIERAILEVIATGVASGYETLQEYIRSSLLWHTADHTAAMRTLDTALQSLCDDQLIELVPESDTAYMATQLGAAITAAGLTPQDGLFVHADLRKALSSFAMDTETHVLYLFTPIPPSLPQQAITSDIDWTIFRSVLDTADELSLAALRTIGVSPVLVNKMAHSGQGTLPEDTPSEIQSARVYRRAYSMFALRDLCNEVPVSTIAAKYSLPRGNIQNLQQTCHGFAAGTIKFCRRMAATCHTSRAPCQGGATTSRPVRVPIDAAGFGMLAAVLEHMQDRLHAGARADLLEMTQVTFVKGRMARVLYEAGFKSLRALAEADPVQDIVPVMASLSGWKARLPHGEQDAGQATRRARLTEKLRLKAEILVGSATRLWERECVYRYDEE